MLTGPTRASAPPPDAPRIDARPARDRRLVEVLLLGLLTYYALTLGGHHYSIDGILMFEAAKQLLFQRSFGFDPPIVWGSRTLFTSFYGIGLTLAYVPGLILLAPFAAWIPHLTTVPFTPGLRYNPALYSNLPYLLSSWLNPLITAVTAILVFRLARGLSLSARWSVGAALVYGLASPAVAYARFDFAQPLASLALTGALVLLRGARARHRLVGAGLSLGAMILTRPELVILTPLILAWVVVSTRRVRDAIPVTIPIVVAVALNLVVNRARHGSATTTGFRSLATICSSSPFDVAVGIFGLLAGPSHGLLVFFPLAWLGLLGLASMLRAERAVALLWGGLLVTGLLFYGAISFWWGGWSWGPRFLLTFVPPLAVAASFWVSAGRQGAPPWRLALFFSLGAVGVLVAWNGILVDFVTFYGWLERKGELPGHALTQLRIWPSPLASGWALLGLSSPDLLWLRTWRVGGGVRLAGLMAVALLMAILAWSSTRMAALLRADAHATAHVTAGSTSVST
jgi:hypothetical protein